jgi:hypothetical protein
LDQEDVVPERAYAGVPTDNVRQPGVFHFAHPVGIKPEKRIVLIPEAVTFPQTGTGLLLEPSTVRDSRAEANPAAALPAGHKTTRVAIMTAIHILPLPMVLSSPAGQLKSGMMLQCRGLGISIFKKGYKIATS